MCNIELHIKTQVTRLTISLYFNFQPSHDYCPIGFYIFSCQVSHVIRHVSSCCSCSEPSNSGGIITWSDITFCSDLEPDISSQRLELKKSVFIDLTASAICRGDHCPVILYCNTDCWLELEEDLLCSLNVTIKRWERERRVSDDCWVK